VTGTPGSNGWYVTDVLVSWTVVDPESAIISTLGCDPATVDYDIPGVIFTCEATSAGGIASESVTFKRDATPPVVAISTPADSAVYGLGMPVLASWAASDAMSGIDTVTATAVNGGPVDTSTAGTKTFTLSATDNAGNTASVTHSYIVLSAAFTPWMLKNDTMAELEDLKTGDKKTDKKIDKAIKHIEKSLEAELWVDDTHLDPKHGHKVFDEEKKAVKDLMKLCKKETSCPYDDVISNIVLADKLLAATAIYDAENAPVVNPANQDKVDKEIAKAEEEFAKAEELSDEQPDKAIDYYKKAWKHAQQALKHAAKASASEDDDDDEDDEDDE
jgi:hypothetical protein